MREIEKNREIINREWLQDDDDEMAEKKKTKRKQNGNGFEKTKDKR